MANKYIDVSATYNGDGTASNQAASAGAVGAWNNFINVVTGSPGYGSLNGGDNVYIRSANSGGNLSVITASNIQSVNGPSHDTPISFIFDSGVIWSESGQFTIELNGSGNSLTLGLYTSWIGSESGINSSLRIYQSGYTATTNVITFLGATLKGAYILGRVGNVSTPCSLRFLNTYVGSTSRVIDCYWKLGSWYSTLIQITTRLSVIMRNFTIDATDTPTPASTGSGAIFGVSGISVTILDVIGLIILGDTAEHHLYSCSYGDTPNGLTVNNLVTENNLLTFENTQTSDVGTTLQRTDPLITVSGINNEAFDFCQLNPAYIIDWRKGLNYPYLNAVLPDNTNTPWSYKVNPLYASPGRPIPCMSINKLYTAEAAICTFTFEMLSHEDLASPTANQWWVEVIYQMDAGGIDSISSFQIGVPLEESNASWTPLLNGKVSYGPQSYLRYKISVTTSAAVKQNTLIYARLYTTVSFADKTKYLFIDPEFLIEVV